VRRGIYISAHSIHTHVAESYAWHLGQIQAHDRSVRALRKVKLKERQATYKVVKAPPKACTWKVNAKGVGVLTVRGRKPPYITQSEWETLCLDHTDSIEAIQGTLKRRKIPIRDTET